MSRKCVLASYRRFLFADTAEKPLRFFCVIGLEAEFRFTRLASADATPDQVRLGVCFFFLNRSVARLKQRLKFFLR
jgi:hypothetical protein